MSTPTSQRSVADVKICPLYYYKEVKWLTSSCYELMYPWGCSLDKLVKRG
jgi:hypothetical protein